jgi:type I restriction enzyme, S subunit
MEAEKNHKTDVGTIMDALNVKGIIRLAVPMPPVKLIERFESEVRPIRHMVEVLVERSANLRATRDLLLPRLISGEIDVSKLDLAGVVESV